MLEKRLTSIIDNEMVKLVYDPESKQIKYYLRDKRQCIFIDLSDTLYAVQYYHTSKDLVLIDESNNHKVFLNHNGLIFSLKLEPNQSLRILSKKMFLVQGGGQDKVLCLIDKKVIPMQKRPQKRTLLSAGEYCEEKSTSGEVMISTKHSSVRAAGMPHKLIKIGSQKTQSSSIQFPPIDSPESTNTMSPELSFMVRYNLKSPVMMLERFLQELDNKQILTRDGTAANILKVAFISSQVFVSLDEGGRLDFWRIGTHTTDFIRSYYPAQFPNMTVYNDFHISKDNQSITLKHKDQIDRYRVATEGLDNLEEIVAARTKEAPKTEAEAPTLTPGPQHQDTEEDAYPVSAKLISRPKVDHIETNNKRDNGSSPSHERHQERSRFRRTRAKIYIGIDFGTSRTKVSFNNEASRQYQPLSFEDMLPQGLIEKDSFERYVIPTIATVIGDGVYYGYEALIKGDYRFSNFKQKILKPGEDRASAKVCSGFLAYVMDLAIEKIKQLINTTDEDEYIFSVCIPVDQMNDNDIVERFRLIMDHALCLLGNQGYRSVKAVHHEWHEDPAQGGRSNVQLHLIPETVAEILDYQARCTDSGIHAVYDFGAGTTDLSIIYMNRLQNRAEILEAAIVYKGYAHIDNLRLKKVLQPDDVKNYYQEIWEEFHASDVWCRAKAKFPGIESMRYFYEMKVVGSGGAFNDPDVRKVFSQVPLYDKEPNECIRKNIMQLQDPPDWEGYLPPYFRYAVSFGLTAKPEETNARFLLPRDVGPRDYTPPIRPDDYNPEPTPNQDWLR